ncbi:MAG: IS3 family transposase [Geodermatophilaceae bacterium]
MPKRYPSDQRERSVRMVMDRLEEYPSPWAAAQALGPKLGVGAETLRKWILQAQVDGGSRSGPTSEDLAEIRRLRMEVRDLKEANEILKAASNFLRRGARPSPPLICGFIDAQRVVGHRVELSCQVLREQGLAVTPRSYRSWRAGRALPDRTFSDAAVIDLLRGLRTGGTDGGRRPEVLYGRRKMTRWLRRNGFPDIGKRTVDRLMREETMCGVIRGARTKTTIGAKPGTEKVRAADLLKRNFRTGAPNRAWVTDFTYVATWAGFVYVAFAIDLFSRSIVGWSIATVKDVAFVEACLKMALWRRDHHGQPIPAGMVHHPDAGSQYTSIRFTETLVLEGLAVSVGTVGQALDNAAAESFMGLYKNEAIRVDSPFRHGPLRQLADVETLTMNYVHWYNTARLHSLLDYATPDEHEAAFYANKSLPPDGQDPSGTAAA